MVIEVIEPKENEMLHVYNCSACGGEHETVFLYQLENKVDDYTHYFICSQIEVFVKYV